MSDIPVPDAGSHLVRACRISDASGLADLYRRSVLHYGPLAYSPAQVKAWAGSISSEKISTRISDGRYVIVAVDMSDNMLGWGDLEADGHIDFLYVAPEARDRRVGSTLYGAIEKQARAAAMPRLYVEASELARHLFARRGFTLLHRNNLSVGGVTIHNFSMEKPLV